VAARRGRLSSYRFRRRLLWVGIWTGFLVSLAVVGVIFWNTANNKETFSNEPAEVFVPPKKLKLTGDDKKAIGVVARQFVETAVAREHPEQAYELVGPLLKGGLTKEEWKHGDIPVVYYPVDAARWKVEYATEVEVGLSVLLFPRQGAQVRPTVFSMALAPQSDRTWLITAWAPRGGSPNTVSSAVKTPEQAIDDVFNPPPERYSTRTSPVWLLLPVVFILLAFAVPVAIGVNNRRGARRIRRQLDRRT
jgi:hypothetical protein